MTLKKFKSYELFKSDALELYPFLGTNEAEIQRMFKEYKELHPALIKTMMDEEIVEKVYESYDDRQGIVDVKR